jgi:RNA polymerase sigma-70 factor (ECF subfamily)
MDRGELTQLVEDCAVVALRAIEGKLDTFRNDSRFTTWAYSVAVKHAAGELRFRSYLATSTQ